MLFENRKVRFPVIRDCPERVVVVRQRREEDAEEETCRCGAVSWGSSCAARRLKSVAGVAWRARPRVG